MDISGGRDVQRMGISHFRAIYSLADSLQFSELSITVAQIFCVPPISYTPTELGHLNTFPAVGAFLAFAVLSALADSSPKWAGGKNHRIYEPEFRLYLISFGLFFRVPGLALFDSMLVLRLRTTRLAGGHQLPLWNVSKVDRWNT